MKTLNQYAIRIIMLGMVSLFTLSAYAQKETEEFTGLISLDTVSVVVNQHSLEKMVSKIVLNKNFKYRKALRKSKMSNKQFVFLNTTISEGEILKHFKRAARRSESVDEFIGYFYDRNLSFLMALDGNVIAGLYDTLRKTTFNGYLDELEAVVGSNY